MDFDAIAERIEKFLREQYFIADDDPGFTRTVDIYESGYVDSIVLMRTIVRPSRASSEPTRAARSASDGSAPSSRRNCSRAASFSPIFR